MAFLIITESIDSTIESLKSEINLHQTVYDQTKDPIYLQKKEIYEQKLSAAERYQAFFEKRSAYQKIKHLKTMNPALYITKCKEITKGIRGVDFVAKTMEFRIRITKNGKRVQVGTVDTPDDALEILQLYI